MKLDSSRHRLQPGKKLDIKKISTRGRDFREDRDQAEEEFFQLREELAEWQRRFYAESRRKMLVVLQAMDAGGKDSTIRKVFQGVNPQGVRVTSFKKPTRRELAQDFLWRIHQHTPQNGMIGVFNRSHYEDVLVVRVHDIVPEGVWRPRYDHINNFEKALCDSNTTIIKIFLHISPEEQKERFQDRLNEPNKNWKFSSDDLEKRKHWDGYMEAFEEMLEKCSTDYAPWYAIPADQKWYRNFAIAEILVDTFRKLDPNYPPPEDGIENIVIE